MTSITNLTGCVRLYDKNGNHVLSILRCNDDYVCGNDENPIYDLCTPDGKVVHCDITQDIVDTFIDYFGVEPTQTT